MSDIWVFSERKELLAELINGARELATEAGGQVVALVLGPRGANDDALAQGADKVLWLGEPGDNMVEDYVATIAGLVESREPALLLVGATKQGKAVAGRLAADLKTSVITDAKWLQWEDGAIKGQHLIFGGGAVQVEKSAVKVTLATVGAGIFEPGGGGGQGEVEEVAFVEPAWRLKLREVKPKPPSSVNLAVAKRVVCAGLGIKQKEDLKLVEDLARVLEGEVACTRPLAEGLDWLPRERYIGVSGAVIKADLYIGVGVSGQVQHTVGITDTRIVVGINKDEKAPIFEQADYGIVGDLYKVVPALTEALKNR